MNSLKNRGVQGVLIAVVDGLKGFPEAIATRAARKIVKTRGSFPNEGAALELVFLALRNYGVHWRRPIEGTAASGQFAILFDDRFSASARRRRKTVSRRLSLKVPDASPIRSRHAPSDRDPASEVAPRRTARSLRCLIRAETRVESGAAVRTETACFTSSGVLGVTFVDDQSRLRKGHGARDMATVRHFALDLVRTAADRHAIKSRRKIAGRDPSCLDAILSSSPA